MKKVLKLTNEQAQSLYSILSGLKLDSIKNRTRWKFLDVIEPSILSYEKEGQELRDSFRRLDSKSEEYPALLKEINKKGSDLSTAYTEYSFSDREVFGQAKGFFELAGVDLEGRKSKMYKEIEDAFLDVKELE